MSLLGLILLVIVVGTMAVWIGRRALNLGSGAWRPAIDAAARSLGGRAALAGGDAELRAEAEGVTVTVKVKGAVATAEAPLYPGAEELRIYVASGLTAPLEDLSYIPEVPLPPAFGLEPPVILRSDSPDRASRIAEDAVLDLSRARRDAKASSVELLVRGGSLRLTVRGARPGPDAIETLVRTAARLVPRIGGSRALAEAKVKQIPAQASSIDRCALCGGERRAGVEWVRCRSCSSPHHAECWATAQRCAKEDCGSVQADPI